MLCLSRKRMVVTKDRPHDPGHSVTMLIVVECEDHSAIQAPQVVRLGACRANIKVRIVVFDVAIHCDLWCRQWVERFYFVLEMGHTQSLFCIMLPCGLFKHQSNVQQTHVENDCSILQPWDSNSRPLGHESPPVTTRPGLPPRLYSKMVHPRPLFVLFSVFSNKQTIQLFHQIIAKKSIKYPVLEFEPTTSWIRVVSHSH